MDFGRWARACGRVLVIAIIASQIVTPMPTATAGTPAAWPAAAGSSSHSGYSDQWFGSQLREIWRYEAGSAVFTQPVSDGTRLYAGSDGGRFFALDPVTGTELWSYEAGSAIKDAAALSGERIFFATLYGDVVALGAADGQPLWRVSISERIDAGPTVVGETVVVPCSNGSVYALSAADGKIIWRNQIGLGIRLLSVPGWSGQGAVIIEGDGGLRALAPDTGSVLWSADWRGEFRYWPVTLADEIVIAGSGDSAGGLAAVDPQSGAIRHRYVYSGDNHWSAPAVDSRDGSVYAGLEGGVLAFDRDLNLRTSWMNQADAKVSTKTGTKRYVMWQPLILGDLVVVPGHLEISTADALFFFAGDGTAAYIGKQLLPAKLASSPAVVDSVLYYGTFDGHLIAMAPVRVRVDGQLVDFRRSQPIQHPVTNRVLVPARAVVELAGGTVDWDQSTLTATCRLGGHIVQLTNENPIALIDGQPVQLDQPATIISGSMLVPIRRVMEGLGGSVAWDEQTDTVIVTMGDIGSIR